MSCADGEATRSTAAPDDGIAWMTNAIAENSPDKARHRLSRVSRLLLPFPFQGNWGRPESLSPFGHSPGALPATRLSPAAVSGHDDTPIQRRCSLILQSFPSRFSREP